MIKKTLIGASLSIALVTAFVSTEAKVTEGADNDTLTELKAALKVAFRSEPNSIKESLIPNVYEAMYGTEVVYLSSDGKYFLAGDMIEVASRKNVSELAKQSVRLDILNRQDNKPVVFKAKNEKHVLTVFTDIDCPYCAKLHREMPKLNENGITVKYLMFPRAGLQSKSFETAVSMWCADDSLKAMTDAKERKPIEAKTCENPIATQYQLGKEVGVTGTPALITESGRLIPGYMPADRLTAALESEKKK